MLFGAHSEPCLASELDNTKLCSVFRRYGAEQNYMILFLAENVYSKNPVLRSPKEKPGCNSTLTTGNGSLFRSLKDKNEKGRNGKHLDGFFQKFQNHIQDPNPANSCSGNKEVSALIDSRIGCIIILTKNQVN